LKNTQLSGWLVRTVVAIVGAAMMSSVQADYSSHPKAKTFIDEMVSEHQFDRSELMQLFKQVEKKQSILDAIARPAEKTLTWKEYRNIFLTDSRISKGVKFWLDNHEALTRMESELGVPAQIAVAIIGVETRYGGNMGSYRVMDALSTLGFDYPPRSKFFTKELREFLLLSREQKQEPLNLKGSYAGAMGFGQFMPSSYRAYAKDFDGDGFTDIWGNTTDAIGSVGNYFVRHGWTKGDPVVSRARVSKGFNDEWLNVSLKPKHTLSELKRAGFSSVDDLRSMDDDSAASAIKLNGALGAEFWLGLNNFYVITRYNHSRLYAMAVYQLSNEIQQAMDHAQ